VEEEARGREPLRQRRKRRWRCGGRSRGGSSSSGSSSKPTGDECRRCGKMGQWACECRSKPRKEQAHITQDEEEASFMLMTTIIIHP
jgi:hypothetical protein